MAHTVILSPHPDDAVLSLWHVLAAPGEVRVVNVFAGTPSGEGLGWWDAETGATDARTRAHERREEDRAALALAGRTATNLDFIDAQYRDDEQPVEPIVQAIAAASPANAVLLAPAGLGAHADHGLVRAAALQLRGHGRRVALYADIPHATRYGWPPWVKNGAGPGSAHEPSERWRADMIGTGLDLAELEPRVHALSSTQSAHKLAAVTEYRTQLPALEAEFALEAHPEVLRYEVVWEL